jgi:hypothetical protein
MSLKRRLKNIFTLAVVAMVIGAATANAAVIFVVDAPNDEDTERGSRPSAGTSWPATVSQTFDLSTKGDSAAGLSGTLYVSGTGWFEPSGPVLTERFNNDYAGDLGNATHTATWTATGYPSGTEVEVYSTWRSRGHYAGSAPYSINGADPITVSMKVPSVGDLVLADPKGGTENFQFIGTGMADGAGQVQVVLSGQSGWAPVDAMAFVSGPLDPNLPSVDAGADMISWSGQAVLMDPNVVNNDTEVPQRPLSYAWSADPPDGVEFDPNEFVEAPAVTITKATDNPSVVTMTLAVTLEGKDPVTDTMTIDVYDDSCLAGKAVGLAVIDPTDFDENCITNFADFAVIATTWFYDYTLTEPAAK